MAEANARTKQYTTAAVTISYIFKSTQSLRQVPSGQVTTHELLVRGQEYYFSNALVWDWLKLQTSKSESRNVKMKKKWHGIWSWKDQTSFQYKTK
jgi:hypothetical protein